MVAAGWKEVLRAPAAHGVSSNKLLVPAPQGMGRQRPMMGFLITDCTEGGCYKGRVSGTTRVATTQLGSEAASSDPIPWSIDRMA